MIIKNPINEIFTPNSLESIKDITKRYMDTLEQHGYMPKPNLIKHKRITLPQSLQHLKTKEEREERQLEYFRRWKNGHDALNGTMYSYVNYTSILDRAGGGGIRPEYREYTNKTFELIESCLYGNSNYFGDNRGQGIIWLSKRGLGKSAELGHAMNTVISVNKEVTALLTSKDEDASDSFLQQKVKFNFYRYPSYLRYSEIENNRGVYHVGKKTKDKDGNTIILGNDSRIVSRAPTPESLEGYGARIWGHDESGKTKNLLQLIDNTLPALNGKDGITRVGVPILTGVAGDFDKFGQDYIDLWDKAETRDLIRWFVPAFAGMHVDDYGNEDIEKAVFEIMTKRYKLFQYNNDQQLAGEMQKFPLTPEEALQSTGTSIFNKTKLFHQSKVLASNDNYMREGELNWDDNRKNITFFPKKGGKIKFIETPQRESITSAIYIAFVDAYGIQQKQTIGSKGAMYVFKRKVKMNDFEKEQLFTQLQDAVTLKQKLDIHLRMGYLPVCEYIDNPDDPRTFAEYCSRICTWYNCKALVEREPSPIHIWFLDNAKHLMQRKPLKASDVNIDFKEYGLKVDEYWKDHRRSFLQQYVEDYSDRIYFPNLVLDMTRYDDTVQTKKLDSVDALGGCLIHDSQKRLLGDNIVKTTGQVQKLFGFTRENNRFKKT